MPQTPTARTEGIAKEPLAGELLVYDLDRDKAYCLNPTAALVLGCCDGRASVPQIAKRLKMDETAVWYALDQFNRDRLLVEKIALPAALAKLSRREQLRAMGEVAAVAIPLVMAIMAPTPAHAASKNTPNGGSCSNGGNCTSGHCCKVLGQSTGICTANCGGACTANPKDCA